MTKEKFRTKMKEYGIMPPRYWKSRPITITSTNEIVDPYKPPQGDGKASILSKQALQSVVNNLGNKKDNLLALRKIRSYDSDFSSNAFAQEAHDLYVKAHEILMKKDPEELSEYVTERSIMDMMEGLKFQTLRWKFIESLEPPLVTQARVMPLLKETNLFAQVTVRFHTKQKLAIYDRFGRLYYGSEVIAKDVLEYVVFEKHIVNEYGKWRLHGKIIPDWVPESAPLPKTYRVEPLEKEEDDHYDIVEEQHESQPMAEVPNEDSVVTAR
ncbi:hypothetical protein RUM44_000769 [Polyplax serrata]|uniref:Large ribosomal subunit protein mL45 n=1 Tax=Polyplax serrata TaxID=468196 RepID=A0ABR1B8Z7_POLSC